jgi:hypothetical protein
MRNLLNGKAIGEAPFHFDDFSYRLSILKISPIVFPFLKLLLSPFHFEDFIYRVSIFKTSPIAFPF